MKRCTIELPDSVSLEGRLRIYKDATMPHVGLIIIHPYSMLGGSMYDTVVGEVSRYDRITERSLIYFYQALVMRMLATI